MFRHLFAPSFEVFNGSGSAHPVEVGANQVDVGGRIVATDIDAVNGDVGVIATGLPTPPCKWDSGQGAQATLFVEDAEHIVWGDFELNVWRSSPPTRTERGNRADDEGACVFLISEAMGVVPTRSALSSPPPDFTRPAPL